MTTLTLFLWLTLAGRPVALEVEAEACHAAVAAYASGELVQVEDEHGVKHTAVRVACVAACPEQEATS